ncbi:hypothetical protein V1525DRAFT_406139 [Lipomyces kononenkoae]|uniref:Uncharacterized protein n=1 Tax=Lipomyces kononenkoae TaxID=34357 RepID=A0ACC3SZG2_LIPKO
MRSLDAVIKEYFPDRGNGLVAAKDFTAYAEIFKKTPDVSVPDSGFRSQICANCFVIAPNTEDRVQPASVQKVSACGKCRVSYYCSQLCQLQDWKAYHKRECKVLASLAPQVPPSPVVLLLRIVMMQGDKRDKFFKSMEELMSHVEERRKMDDFPTLVLMGKGAKEYSGTDLPLDAVVEMLCKVMTNSASVTNPNYDTVGLMFDPLVSLINHSCEPNAVLVFDKNVLFLRAIRPIKKGEEILITYTDNTMPMPQRKQQLRTRYFFDCQCTACRPPVDSGLKPDPRNDFTCPKCCTPFQPYSTPSGPGVQLYNNISACSSCRYRFPDAPNVVANLEDRIVSTGIADISGIESDAMANKLMTKLKQLHKLGMIPIHRSPFVEAFAYLIPYYMTQQDWSTALALIGIEYFLQDQVRSRQPEFMPVRLAHMMRFVVVLLYVINFGASRRLEQCSIDLHECLWGLVVELERSISPMYGKNSTFEIHVRDKYKNVMLMQMGPDLARVHTRRTLEQLGWHKEMDKIKAYAMNFLNDSDIMEIETFHVNSDILDVD